MNGTANCVYPAPITEVVPMLDPLSYLSPPPIPDTAIGFNTLINAGEVVTLYPGRYDNGINITGATVNFMPGVYILNGRGLSVTGTSTLTAIESGGELGVMFYNTNTAGDPGGWGDIYIGASVTANLIAPTSGPYEGILFWNDARAPDKRPGHVIAGTSDSIFEGALYFPSTHLQFTGTSTAGNWTMLVADTITIQGNAEIEADYSLSAASPPTRKMTLVE
jgi:hypothetical protein